jgi:type I restriction enzyme S subunit
MKGHSTLPQGWTWTTLEEILLTLESGGRPKGGARNVKEGIPSIGGEHLLYDGGFDFAKIRYVPKEFYQKMMRGKILKKDILVVKDGATTGKTAFVPDSFPFQEAAVNEHVFILRVSEKYIEPKYLFFWMQSPFGQQCVKDNFQGTAQGGINTYFIKNSQFPCPPFAEQGRIVARVEELFSNLDAGIDALKKVRMQLKRYRQAILKNAFEGKLTEEWRKTHQDHVESRQILLENIRKIQKLTIQQRRINSVDRSQSRDLPENWIWSTIDETSDLISGQHVLKGRYNQKKEGIPYLTGPQDFQLKYPTATKWTTEPKVISNNNDVLVTVKGAGVGKTNMLKLKEAAISRQLMAIRSRFPNPDYIFYYLQSAFSTLRRLGSGSTVPGIRREQILSFPIPLTSLSEQNKIVEEIEQCLSVADETEEIAEQALRQSETLHQSILKKAFEGKLVEQVPMDEPAEKLLERIRKDRAKHEAERKSESKPQIQQMRLI